MIATPISSECSFSSRPPTSSAASRYMRLLTIMTICCSHPTLVAPFSLGGTDSYRSTNRVSSVAGEDPWSFFNSVQRRDSRMRLNMTADGDDEIARQLAKARDLLANAKAKIADQESVTSVSVATKDDDADENDESGDMFFASAQLNDATDGDELSSAKREKVIRSRDSATGLITTDGELMAELSETEEWEVRPLYEVFEDEAKDGSSMASRQLNERDVAASLFNLRKSMQNEDYKKIFDERNRFIGETD